VKFFFNDNFFKHNFPFFRVPAKCADSLRKQIESKTTNRTVPLKTLMSAQHTVQRFVDNQKMSESSCVRRNKIIF
jgi:hypothetical protein